MSGKCWPKSIAARFVVLTPMPWKSKVNTGRGDPQTVIVGLPDAAVKESKGRVNTSILNSRLRSEAMPRHAGFEMPKERLTEESRGFFHGFRK